MPNELPIAMSTAAPNEHTEGVSFEAMDVDAIEAAIWEERHGVHVCKIMMNVLAPSNKKGYDRKMWHSWCGSMMMLEEESVGAVVCCKTWGIDFSPEEMSHEEYFIEHAFSRQPLSC